MCAAPVNNVNLSGGGRGVTHRSLVAAVVVVVGDTPRGATSTCLIPLRTRGRRPRARVGFTRGGGDDDVDVEDEGRLVPENNCRPCYL